VCPCETEIETESGAKRLFSPFRGLESGTASVNLSSPERGGARDSRYREVWNSYPLLMDFKTLEKMLRTRNAAKDAVAATNTHTENMLTA